MFRVLINGILPAINLNNASSLVGSPTECKKMNGGLITDLGVFDFEGAAAGVDVCSVQRCFGSLSTLNRIEREDRVKEFTQQSKTKAL